MKKETGGDGDISSMFGSEPSMVLHRVETMQHAEGSFRKIPSDSIRNAEVCQLVAVEYIVKGLVQHNSD